MALLQFIQSRIVGLLLCFQFSLNGYVAGLGWIIFASWLLFCISDYFCKWLLFSVYPTIYFASWLLFSVYRSQSCEKQRSTLSPIKRLFAPEGPPALTSPVLRLQIPSEWYGEGAGSKNCNNIYVYQWEIKKYVCIIHHHTWRRYRIIVNMNSPNYLPYKSVHTVFCVLPLPSPPFLQPLVSHGPVPPYAVVSSSEWHFHDYWHFPRVADRVHLVEDGVPH